MRIRWSCLPFAALLWISSNALAIGLSPFDDVAGVSAGNLHTCARTTPGAVWCWGANESNQLGVGEGSTLTSRLTPVPVPGLFAVRSVSSGQAHNCVIAADRSVQCWGLNFAGQAGDASLRYSIGAPNPVAGLSGPALVLALGGLHSCALIEGGRVECWGDDSHGQLGDGSPGGERASAAAVQQLGGVALAIAAGDSHTCALLANGDVRCWGLNEVGQLGDNTTSSRALPVSVQGLPGAARRIAAGSASTCAVTLAGALHCWGPQYPLLAFDGGSLIARAYPGFGSGALDVTAGSAFYCVLFGGNEVRCLGENAFGQFGTGPVDGSLGVDAAVDLAADIEEIEAGSNHTCARSASGGLQCWGDNRFGQLGIDATSLRLVPTQVSGLTSGIADVGIGNYHGCALTTGGAVKCWGSNGAQQVGDGTTALRLTPVDVLGLSAGVRALDVGANSSCVITAERRVRCWGANYGGQLGNGGIPDTAPPGPVQGLGEVNALAVGVGNEHACALLDGGVVKCWGSNGNGQLGDGSTQRRDSAVDVVGLGTGVKAIGVGYFHTCAITAGNGMKCWGINENGQLGDGSTTQRLTPVDVVGLSSGVTAIGPGGLHTCAVVGGGAVKCWGANFFGLLLGDGSQTDRSVPGDVPALNAGVRDLAVSLFGSCALLDSGALRCWGDSGVIGDNSNLGRPLPTEPSGLGRGVSATDTGYGLGGHACAVSFGAAKCWGENTFATLGDGTTHGVPTAQTVVSNQIRRRVAALAAARSAEVDGVQLDASGRFVLLVSEAANLTSGDSNGTADVFLFDRERRTARRVSVDDAGAQIAGASRSPSMSASAGLVAFVAPDAGVGKLRGESAKQAAARRKANGESVYLHNLLTGSTQQVGSSGSADPSPQISADGSTIVYTAPVTDDSEGTVGQDNLYVVQVSPESDDVALSDPVCTTCKPTSTSGSSGLAKADGASSEPVLSADGQWLAYTTEAKNGVADQASPCPTAGTEVLLQNLLTGSTQRISPPPGTSSGQCGSLGSSSPSIDYAGNTIALQSDQPLDTDDGNGLEDIYVFSTTDDSVVRVSEGAAGEDGNGASAEPKLSGDGAHVAFVSGAGNLDASFADNNDTDDVHTVALGGAPTRLSLSATGAEANAASASPVLNFDGSQVAFLSSASLLTGGTGTSVLARENPAAPTKKSATWWLPAESGWGLTVFDQGSVLTPTWFTYDSDGEPTWFLVAGAFPQPDGSFTGEVYRFKGTPLAQINGEAATSVALAGTSRLNYIGEDVLNFQYTVDGFNQTKVLRRFPFGQRSFSCNASPEISRASADNYTDLWSGATPNAGWGLTLFHIDDLLVAIWYTYDTDGEAVFFVINANRQPDGTFSGEIFRQRNGVPFSQIDGALPSADADVVGAASFRFLDGERAEFSYVMGLTVQTRAIERLVVGDVTQVCRTADVGGD